MNEDKVLFMAIYGPKAIIMNHHELFTKHMENRTHYPPLVDCKPIN